MTSFRCHPSCHCLSQNDDRTNLRFRKLVVKYEFRVEMRASSSIEKIGGLENRVLGAQQKQRGLGENTIGIATFFTLSARRV